MFGFFREVFSVVSKRAWWLVVLNWLFFGLIAVGGLLGSLVGVGGFVAWPVREASSLEADNPLILFGGIFILNLVLSGFAIVTLSGLVFFILSPVLLGFRAFLWGVLLNGLSTSKFLVALPTIVLEGEGYVIAGLAGVLLGLSWLKPEWTFGEDMFSRSEAFKEALKDSAHIYILVAIVLLAGAIVETMTLVYI